MVRCCGIGGVVGWSDEVAPEWFCRMIGGLRHLSLPWPSHAFANIKVGLDSTLDFLFNLLDVTIFCFSFIKSTTAFTIINHSHAYSKREATTSSLINILGIPLNQ